MARRQSPETISRRMASVRSRNTAPERKARSIVHALGARFRVGNRDLPGSPDLANRTKRWAVFVHGCFWHSHQQCLRATQPKTNRVYWRAKFRANRTRDVAVVTRLQELGFRVLIVWECDLKGPAAERRLRAFFGKRAQLSRWRVTRLLPPRRRPV